MSTDQQQKSSACGKKTPRLVSLIIWIVLILIIGVVLWGVYTEKGLQTFGTIMDKGFSAWLFGEGETKAEADAAAVLEKNDVGVVKMPGQGVSSLDFTKCPKPSDEVLKELTKLNSLQSITLTNVQITDDQFAYCNKMSKLTNLLLGNTQITDAGMEHIRGLKSLYTLYLVGLKVTDKGLESIVDLPLLAVLDLSGTEVTDQGMKSVAKLKNLNHLFLRNTKVTDTGLAELDAVATLKRLTLSKNMKISKEAIEKLNKKFPDIRIEFEDYDPKRTETAVPADESGKPDDQSAAAPDKNTDEK